jgi:ATP-dependent helicase/nuclease subunit A
MTALPDALDRREAVFSSGPAVVWASAGTGKTHTLILRALHLLLELASDGLFSPDRSARSAAALRAFRSLLLITFTRKAAAEMQTRLCRYLDLILQPSGSRSAGSVSDPLFPELVEHWLQRCGDWDRLRAGVEIIAENLTEAQISTIHSYAAGMLFRYPLQAGLPADCRPAREDEDDLADFNDRLLESWWKRRAFTDPDTAPRLESVLQTLDFDELQVWLAAVLQHPWIVSRMSSVVATGTDRLPAVIFALGRMADLLQHLAGSKLNRLGRELAGLLHPEPDWRRLAAFAIEHETYLFRKRNKSLASALAQLPGSLRMVLDDFTGLYQVLQSCAVASFGDGWAALESLLQRFRDWSQDAGVRDLRLVSFDDILRRAVRLLKGNPGVLAEECRRLRAVLVDEFQDTDPVQLELLELLLGPASCNPALGFLVGDPKQSIYRFRGADVVSVGHFCRSYSGGGGTGQSAPARQFHLRTTFRCSPAITCFVNRFFSRCVPLAETEETQLSPVSTEAGPLPTWWLIESSPDEPSGVEAARERMASVLVNVIRDLVHRPENHVRRRFHEILVLGRSHRELDAILRGLQGAGIPAVSSGSRTFYRHPEVLDVVNLLICLHQPLDELAMATVLRSPLVGMDDPEVARLIRDPGLGALISGRATPPAWLHEPHRQRLLLLQELAARRSQLHPLEWLAQVFRFIPRAAYLRPDDCEGRALARIEKVLKAFAQELAEGVTPPLTWLLQQRERSSGADQWDAQLGEDVALTDESVDAVRVMTIHKAKGLESPVVIIFDWPGLVGPQARSDSRPTPVLALTTEDGRKQEFQLPFAGLVVRSRGYCEALELDRRQDREETGRLAYVAATRARDLLILLQALNGSAAEAAWLGSMATELGDCVHFVRHRPEQAGEGSGPAAPSGIDLDAYMESWNRRLARPITEPEPLILHPTGLPDLKGPSLETATPAPAGDALAVGTLVHSYLEKYLHTGVFCAHRLAGLAADAFAADVRETAAVLLARFFDGGVADDSGTALIERVRRGRILAREAPILFRHEGKTWQGVIDLVLEEAGTVRGVDFKTGHRADPLPETYRRQSAVYRHALSRLFPDRPVDFEFWWLA